MTSALACAIIVFLSTLSLRRATNNSVSTADKEANFYPRSPCGERRCCHSCTAHSRQFLSTLSLRRATLRVVDGSKSSIISIHALLAESDKLIACQNGQLPDFYPRSPCGERQNTRNSAETT